MRNHIYLRGVFSCPLIQLFRPFYRNGPLVKSVNWKPVSVDGRNVVVPHLHLNQITHNPQLKIRGPKRRRNLFTYRKRAQKNIRRQPLQLPNTIMKNPVLICIGCRRTKYKLLKFSTLESEVHWSHPLLSPV